MSQHHLCIEQSFHEEGAAVFARLSDHDQLQAVFGVPCRRIRAGDAEPNGVGSVRRIGFWPLAVEETVVAQQAGRRIDYRISRGGGPLRAHRGQIEFHERDGACQVIWQIWFESPLPGVGGLVAGVLAGGIRRGLRKMADKGR